jgi:hypothetical protein
MNMMSIYKTLIIAMALLFNFFTVHADSQIRLEGKFDLNRALLISWGNPNLSKEKTVWDFPAYISNRPNKKKMLISISNSLFEDLNKRVISVPDKLLNVPSDNSTLILLISTEPFEDDYWCIACSPLLGAQLWHKEDNSWCLLAEDRAITFMGGAGGLNYEDAKVVNVGSNKFGVLIEDDISRGGSTPIETTLLLPSGKGFIIAFQEITGDGYQGDETSYYRYTAKIDFLPGKNVDYFNLRVITSGTNRVKRGGREIPWNREKIYVMNNGRYILKTDLPIMMK